jgi:hypothetical protein
MSIDIYFNKKITVKEVVNNTSLTIVNRFGHYFLCDECGNAVSLYSYKLGDDTFDSFCVRRTNAYKILDELVDKFNVSFIDDDILNSLDRDGKGDNLDKVYLDNMEEHGYLFVDGKFIINEREEGFYNNTNGCEPCKDSTDDEEEDLPF